jgi:hypothetical protein
MKVFNRPVIKVKRSCKKNSETVSPNFLPTTFSGFLSAEKEMFYDKMVVKLIEMLSKRILDVMIGKADPIVDQKYGK